MENNFDFESNSSFESSNIESDLGHGVDKIGEFNLEGTGAEKISEVGIGTISVEDVVEVKDEKEVTKFKEFCDGRNYLILDKRSIAHFINLVGYHTRLGYDVYSSSFKMDVENFELENKLRLVYNNGTILAMSEIDVKESTGKFNSYILSIDNIIRIYTASQGYIFLYEDEGSMYGYVLGGKVFLETYKVEKDICSKDYLMEQLNSDEAEKVSISEEFVNVMKNLYEIVHTGTRLEERALYFVNEYTYIYSGIVLGRFKGVGITMTLQDVDVSTLTRFFFDTDSTIIMQDFGKYVKYSNNGRSVYIGRRGLKLSEDMRYSSFETKNKVTVNPEKIKTIVAFLLGIGNNSGVLTVKKDDAGIKLTCSQKVEEYYSSFIVPGHVQGDSISEVKIPLDILRNFLKVFKSDVVLKTSGSRLYVEGELGEIVILGNM